MELQSNKEKSTRYSITSIDKAIDLLEVLSKNPLNLIELSEILNRPKSSLFRIISTLENRGYISREKETGKYCLGMKTLTLTKNLIENNKLSKVSKAEMKDLVRKTGESVNIGTLSFGDVVYVAVEEGIHQLKFTEVIGSTSPFHATAIGKVIAAHLPTEDLNELVRKRELKKITPNTITDKKQLLEELKKVKDNGYAIDDNEVALGAKCIAAPIFDMFGEVEAAISISGSIHRLKPEKIEEVSCLVKQAAINISQQLGYNQ
ncbi:IclR family transcriptional regulator [Virgibacillus dakarensis]|uniref:IclR family transcriptional regulator n=1 Tax=Virgibacillus dakarensis TaxID=1917889 RepID=UPI000B42F834|nr:IclR family transcriptional regulator [Virgibacillus dakarensis]